MKLRNTAALVFLVSAALVACSGTQGWTPQAGAPALSSASLPALAAHWPLEGPVPDVTSVCNVAPVRVPGNHVLLFASGNITGSTFTSVDGFWFLDPYAIGKPPTTPTPGVTPTPIKGVKQWLYYGTYQLKNKKEGGCALLLTTQSGKPYPKQKTNAFAIGTVVVKVKYIKIGLPIEEGPLSMTITGISTTGGSGSAKLTSSKGKPYDTATITLVGRLALP